MAYPLALCLWMCWAAQNPVKHHWALSLVERTDTLLLSSVPIFWLIQPRIFSLKHGYLVPLQSLQWRIFQIPLETQGKHINQLLICTLLVLLKNSNTIQHNCAVQLLPTKAILAPKEILSLCVSVNSFNIVSANVSCTDVNHITKLFLKDFHGNMVL